MNLIDFIARHARESPGAPALITPQLRLTWAQLDDLVWAAALKLHEHGLREADRVGITLNDAVRHLIACLALIRLGVCQIALPATGPPAARRAAQKKLGLCAVIVDDAQDHPMALRPLRLGRLSTDGAEHARSTGVQSGNAQLPWLIQESSGTTGQPKFALVSQQTALKRYHRYLACFGPMAGELFWPASRIDFIITKQRLLYSLMAGSAVCLPVGLAMSAPLVDFLRQACITRACATPSHLHKLVELRGPLPSVRIFEVTSATIPEALRQAFRATVSPHLHITYAANEAFILTVAPPPLLETTPNTVGTPAPNIVLEVVDASHRPLCAGQVGLVRVRGPGIVDRYLDNPQADAQSFHDGWFYPGDFGWRDASGALFLKGRRDDLMIYDGVNIYPAEIEDAMSEHPCIQDVVAFPARHDQYQDVPCAAVTLRAPMTERALIAHFLPILGVRCPKRVFILTEFPRNPMGKIERHAVARLAAESNRRVVPVTPPAPFANDTDQS